MATQFCTRCKEQRLKEWFGDPKAPYAICLSCRVELNGERKKEKKQKRDIKFSRNCAICTQVLLGAPAEICSQCEEGLKVFNHSPKMLGRAASFLTGKLRQPTKKHKKTRLKIRNSKLHELIRRQAIDDRERGLRFEHAISKA